uniref:Uncharacterized protein n=1 Tax=Spironucleus salmonicida TaxID=348837 RepID=V6LQJ2_9EUKA|eukprot:EST46942.1 Hypothetical protein SS50377_13100 [Spironucleus salmonicida]
MYHSRVVRVFIKENQGQEILLIVIPSYGKAEVQIPLIEKPIVVLAEQRDDNYDIHGHYAHSVSHRKYRSSCALMHALPDVSKGLNMFFGRLLKYLCIGNADFQNYILIMYTEGTFPPTKSICTVNCSATSIPLLWRYQQFLINPRRRNIR